LFSGIANQKANYKVATQLEMEDGVPNLSSQKPNEALHAQLEWLRVTLFSIGDAVITTDVNGRVTFLNPVAQSLTGWTHEAAVGKPLDAVFKIINQETRKTVESPTVRALRDGVIVELANQTMLIAKDGTERPIDDRAAPIRNERKEVAGVVLVFRDITERIRQEQALHDALAYADNIIATMREPFMVLDTNLRIVTANRSFYQNFHVTSEETQGQFVYDLGNRQWDIPRLRILLEEVLPQSNVFQDFEVDHDFPAIGRKIMLLNARRIRKPGNDSELILLAIEDITERRHLERKSKELLAKLSDLHRRKDEFLAMLGHELRNPLAPILNAVQLLRLQRGESGPQQQARAIIERQVGQLVHLVDDLLEVSRIATGTIHLQQEQLDMRAIVECGVETVRPLIAQRHHALDVRLPPSPIWIDGDSTRLEQVVVNLLNNAAKYTDEGGHIWLSLQLAPNGFLGQFQ
jgi:PAS domain S-box-containing protein